MISADPFRGEPIINIDIVGDLSMEMLRSVTIMMSECSHDVAVIDLSTSSPKRLGSYDGYPVSIEYGRQVIASQFVGYVREIRPEFEAGRMVVSKVQAGAQYPLSGVRIVCYGASTRMRQENSRVWQRSTVTAVVAELAKQYRFTSDIEPHDYVWPVIAQGGESDFQLLIELAKMIGYRFTLTGTHLRFYDPLNVLRRPAPDISAAPGRSLATGTLYLRKFAPTLGQNTAAGFGGTIVLDGYDPSTGQPYSFSTTEQGAILGPDKPSVTPAVRHATSDAGTVAQAISDLQAERREKAWPITAEIETTGSVFARPGNLITLDGIEGEYNGMWYIIDVTHEMRDKSWTTTMKVGKDAIGSVDVQRPNLPFVTPPKPMLVLNDWVASRAV